MADIPTVVALIVAGVALLVAAGQLTQQLMATAYVLRKCDRVVTGRVTKGGTRQWHWRQFRFTVQYQAIIFALPAPLYPAIGVRSTVQVDSPSHEVWDRALELRPKRTTAQACWISFIQDLAMSACIKPGSLCLKAESGDRVPEDLTVAPTRVDAITVMLACVAMGMQVSKYSPTTGEISMAGATGGISSSTHPTLGGLLHYSVFADEPTIGFEEAKRHGHAMLQEKGVWANTVFGRFKDRLFQPEFTSLSVLRTRKFGVLMARGWPRDSVTDTIAGAGCFLAFGHIDVYEAVPPSNVRQWCAHFAEVIVKSHLVQLIDDGFKAEVGLTLPKLDQTKQEFIDQYGCSSPYLPWENLGSTEGMRSGNISLDRLPDTDPFFDPESGKVLACTGLIKSACHTTSSDAHNPSSYMPADAAWEAILLADQRLRHIYFTYGQWPDQTFGNCAENIVASAIRSLAEIGIPSWGRASKIIEEWPGIFSAACNEVLKDQTPPVNEQWVSVYARLSMFRAAYYTIMMRSAGGIGSGITEETLPNTALVYMA
ncbi:hypothetical protein MMC30_003058 [Trapelia coarctata]|nr:hypothetical protein [Trapelia coarctata]